MSRSVFRMTARCERLEAWRGRRENVPCKRWSVRIAYVERALTVPLPCSWCGCGFEVEGTDEVEGGFAERHALDTGPQINHVTFFGASSIEAVEDVLVQVDAEGSAAAIAAVDRAGAAALRTVAA